MTKTPDQPKELTKENSRQLLASLERLFEFWLNRDYCPHCVARLLLLHSGLLAAPALTENDMQDVLEYIANLNVEHCPPPSQGTTH
jgi:hypothetical protein